ncbi:short-chain dehydrogenase/reductase [Ensifer sp. ENS12]|uniref:short-chain dehydrogenase/reductase n=1 Tax=Ensifer sp. ENS12 TaxID=2854774 RepID=UPI001C4973FA|nr:short-chain dehydrogenase/reductase [Ensifer sp. ENS12]MBV7518988.1 SDR family oxidoreductase [Ensifer sp. ENS12]
MDLGLNGKSVLVTGGSRGIGLAAARLFRTEGSAVTIVGRDPTSVDTALNSLEAGEGLSANACVADLATAEGRSLIAGRLATTDILVNNAGAIPGGGLDRVTGDIWRQSWDLKVYGYIDLIREVLPIMMARGDGVIINVIGIAGADPRYDYLCGSVANAALIAFTKATGAHTARKGVRMIGINPGPTQTDRLLELYRARAEETFGDRERWPELLGHLPFGRAALPEEIADLVVYLASTRASYISGTVIDADGGAMYG